jgi:hypothetical protein
MSAGCHIREVFSCKKTLFTGPVPVKKTLSCIPVRIWGKFFSCPVFLYDFSVQAKKSCPCSCSCKQDAEPRGKVWQLYEFYAFHVVYDEASDSSSSTRVVAPVASDSITVDFSASVNPVASVNSVAPVSSGQNSEADSANVISSLDSSGFCFSNGPE